MKQILQGINRRQLAIFLCYLLMVSLIYSPFLLSVSIIGLIIISVFNLKIEEKVSFGLHPRLKNNFQRLFQHRAFLTVSLFFFIVLVSGIYSEDMVYWLERLRLKLPFLFLPFVFVSLPAFSERQYLGLLYFLLLLLFVTCMGIGLNYVLHFEEINALIQRGKPMPTPRNHIRFSLLLAFGIMAGTYLYWKKFYWKFQWEKYWIGGITLFLFLFIHILSVRSGLFVFYLASIVLLLRYIYLTGRYVLGLGLMVALLALPGIAYLTIPSFTTKIDYVRWDLSKYFFNKTEELNYHSDTERLISLKIGWQIGREHPLLGVGAGDLKKEVYARYAAQFPQIKKPKMPHNQLLSVFAGTGIWGLLLFCLAFFYPLFYRKNYRDPLFLAFACIIFFSFMMENTIENSMGIGLFAFFWCLGIARLEIKH